MLEGRLTGFQLTGHFVYVFVKEYDLPLTSRKHQVKCIILAIAPITCIPHISNYFIINGLRKLIVDHTLIKLIVMQIHDIMNQ